MPHKNKRKRGRYHSDYSRRRRYGLSKEDYKAMLRKQSYRCYLCESKPKKRSLSVDHNHMTGKIRGLLCNTCNHRILGAVEKFGIERIVEYLKRGGIELAPMTANHYEFMLKLKNDEDTRRFAIASHDIIKKDQHEKWIKAHARSFQVIKSGEDPIGAVRIHKGEVSIWIDRPYRGRRISLYVLNRLTKKKMIARIVVGNVPSMRAFIGAGFLPYAFIDNYYVLKK